MSQRATTSLAATLLAATLGWHVSACAQPSDAPTENAPAGDPPVDNLAADASPSDSPPGEAALPIPPVPPRIAEGAQYEACLDMLATDPSGADTMAATIAAQKSPATAEAAAHCHALAQVELGNTEDGATLLDKLAGTSAAPAASRAVVFAQAAQAWTMAGQNGQALASASQALTLSPDDPEILIGHAIAEIALQLPAQADTDLTHALGLDRNRADALVLRATARRQLGHLPEAHADIDAAFRLDPDNADGLLERGIIRQRTGDLAGARTDWQRAAELAPDTPTGDLAQQNLSLLQAGPRQ